MPRYEITVDCVVGPLTAAGLGGFEIREVGHGRSRLVGEVLDQAAFHGVLNRLQDLHLEILEIQRLDSH